VANSFASTHGAIVKQNKTIGCLNYINDKHYFDAKFKIVLIVTILHVFLDRIYSLNNETLGYPS